MAATLLLSDNGVTSGTSGYKLTGGNDGTLQLQTSTSGGTATTALTIDTSQNVGIGTSSPAARLEAKGAGASITDAAIRINNPNASAYSTAILDLYSNGASRAQLLGQQNNTSNGGLLIFFTGDSSNAIQERMRIDSSGNVGIGISSPSAKLDCIGQVNGAAFYVKSGASTSPIFWDNALSFQQSGVGERMRIDTSGNMTFGGGVNFGGTTYTKVSTATSNGNLAFDNGSTDTPGLHFYYGNNTNFGIDVATSVLRFVKNLDETGGAVVAQIDTNGLLYTNSGYGSVAPAYSCRAWVNFDGTGAASANQTINSSGNISTVFKNSTADYTINFSSALVDTNYAAAFGSGTANGRWSSIYNGTYNTTNSRSAQTTTSLRVIHADTTGSQNPINPFTVTITR